MTNTQLRIAIFGVSGRMGRALLAAIDEIPSATLSGAAVSTESRWIGSDASEPSGGVRRGISISGEPVAALRGAAVAIDFSLPEATSANLEACVAAKCALVIGTTEHDSHGRKAIEEAARHIPVVCAPNMSIGVNLLLRLTQLASATLDASYDIEIFEAHHRNKKDAPSGTALALGRAAASGRGVKLEEVTEDVARGGARGNGTIGFSVFRGGDVVGDHTVTFAGIGERIELTHRASDRMSFARGAVRAAQWVVDKKPGLYSMQDVLELSKIAI